MYDSSIQAVNSEVLAAPDQKKILLPDDPWSDNRALAIVKADFAYAESYRVNAHDWRYRNADELYLGYSGQRYWDGTRVPRSSLGIPVAFMQVESLMPKIIKSVTDPEGYHFYAENELGDDEELIVLAWKEMVVKQLQETRFREQVRRALKSMAQYGNGVLEVGVEEYQDEYIHISSKMVPTKITILNHPTQGPIPIPIQSKEQFSREIKKDTKTRPYVRYISIKDFYVDPNCESPVIQEGAGYVMKRVYMRAEQIKALKDVKDFNIPSDEELADISKAKSTANQDVTKLSSELFRYNMWNPSQDYTSDPSQKRIAVIEYTTSGRKVWWLQGTEFVIYNQPNRYGEINFYSVPYADVLDRWQAQGIPDVCEGEQRLQQAIINARVDETALALHPPMNKRRGVTIPGYQLKIRPGVVREVENPESDVVQQKIQDITQSAYIEVQASELRVQKISGLSDLAGQGVPTAGGNSANRTATGINTQSGATQDRVGYLVESIEDVLIEPVVTAVIRLDRKFLDMKQAANWLKLDARFAKLKAEDVMNAKISAECRGSIKMAARMNFLQTFPQIAPFIFNPELLQMLAQQNQETLNSKAFLKLINDALNYPTTEPLLVKMSQEQIKAMNQPPAGEMMKAQLQSQQMQSDESTNKRNLIVKLLDSLMKEGFNAHTKNAELDDRHIQEMGKLLVALKGQDSGGGAEADS